MSGRRTRQCFAQINLGVMYANGEGVPKIDVKSVH
jgi:TPR repeat protein